MIDCINGGHCPGKDSGAVGASGLQEADVAHDIMQLVMYYLQQAEHKVLTIQENDLQVICDVSNNLGADLFVSIHCNAAENTDAKGTETFYFANSPASQRLAQCIQSQIVDTLNTVDRGVKDGSHLYVIKNTDAPAVLIETAFISNADDEIVLSTEAGRDGIARAIARGITDYVSGR